MSDRLSVAIVGSSGFVGASVTEALRDAGHCLVPVPPAPRITCRESAVTEFIEAWQNGGPMAALATLPSGDPHFSSALKGVDVIVNAAGLAKPLAGAKEREALVGANAMLPLVIHAHQELLAIPHFLHISSAAVRGREPINAEPLWSPATEYAESKAMGERALLRLAANSSGGIHIYRATSVQVPTAKSSIRARLPVIPLAFPFGDSPICSPTDLAESVLKIVEGSVRGTKISVEPCRATTDGTAAALFPKARIVRLPRGSIKSILDGAYAAVNSSPIRARLRRMEVLMLGQSFD